MWRGRAEVSRLLCSPLGEYVLYRVCSVSKGALLIVPGVRLRKNVSTPLRFGWTEQTRGGTFRGPPSPSGLNPCVLASSSTPFCSGCLCLLSPLPSFLWMVWSHFGRHILLNPKPFADSPPCSMSFLGTGCSSMDPVGLCCSSSDWTERCAWRNLNQCWTTVVLWYNYTFCYRISDASCLLLEQDNSNSPQVIHRLKSVDLFWASLQLLWMPSLPIDWGKNCRGTAGGEGRMHVSEVGARLD